MEELTAGTKIMAWLCDDKGEILDDTSLVSFTIKKEDKIEKHESGGTYIIHDGKEYCFYSLLKQNE